MIDSNIFKIISLLLPVLLPGLVLIFALQRDLFAFLNYPIDLNKSFASKRIFGEKKTFRGFLTYLIGAIIISFTLSYFYRKGLNAFIHPVFAINPLFVGLIYGIFYNLGELVNSFIKRRVGISPGEYRFPTQRITDLLDGFIGVAIVLVIFTPVSLLDALFAGILGIIVHSSTDLYMKRASLKS